MREPIYKATFRAFFVTFFVLLAIGAAFMVILIGMVKAIGTSDEGITTTYSTKIQPNADGVRKELPKDTPVILMLDIKGIIGTETLNRNTVRAQLVESREGIFKEDRVKALLLKINSPGGTVTDADGIYKAIKHYKEMYKVPVYAYVDGLCASGGMYIAASADKILASDVSLIGSVGVITPSFFNYTKLLEKLGVDAQTIFAGKGKDDLNPFRPWKKDETEMVQSIIDYYYKHFVNVIVSNRSEVKEKELVDAIGAHVFPAEEAKKYGLIDESNAGYYDALAQLVKHLDFKEDQYQVIELENNNWLTALFKNESLIVTGKVTHQLSVPDELSPKIMNQFLYLYKQE